MRQTKDPAVHTVTAVPLLVFVTEVTHQLQLLGGYHCNRIFLLCNSIVIHFSVSLQQEPEGVQLANIDPAPPTPAPESPESPALSPAPSPAPASAAPSCS